MTHKKARNISSIFFDELSNIRDLLDLDAKAIFDGDPAAKNLDEVILCYPGFLAMAIHRIAHLFYKQNVIILARMFSEYAHKITGIDIHPGATIGNSFCIDHGTGIVIGETTLIGNHVKIYQGVTLGALSFKTRTKNKKRHPTISDNCVIYSNATILGGKTIIGKNSIVGGNVWLTKSVPDDSIVYHKSDILLDENNDDDSKHEIYYEI
jgi:serine O-acetyltransferase